MYRLDGISYSKVLFKTGDGDSYKTAGWNSHGGGIGWTGHRTFRNWSCNLAGYATCRVGRDCGAVVELLRLFHRQRAQVKGFIVRTNVRLWLVPLKLRNRLKHLNVIWFHINLPIICPKIKLKCMPKVSKDHYAQETISLTTKVNIYSSWKSY